MFGEHPPTSLHASVSPAGGDTQGRWAEAADTAAGGGQVAPGVTQLLLNPRRDRAAQFGI